MNKSPYPIILTQEQEQKLKKNISSYNIEHKIYIRSMIILELANNPCNKRVASKLKVTANTVSKWRKRFYLNRLAGLADAKRSGRPPKFPIEVQYELVHIACSNPEGYYRGITRWSYSKLCNTLKMLGIVDSISITRIMTWLKQMSIKPYKVKYWLHQTDPDFEEKMCHILDLYLNPPDDGILLSIDEKTCIPAYIPKVPDKTNSFGNIVKREFEYIKDGKIDLFASFDIKTGKVLGLITQTHNSSDFINFLKLIMSEYSTMQKIHLILDNASSHYSKEVRNWLDSFNHPFEFHFTPNHGSWLNQVEMWFGILSRQCLKNARINGKYDLINLIISYIKTYNKLFAHPFKWQTEKKLLVV